MAKNNNEAKIKFTAETGEFNAAIKAADKTMANLRAEMNLNETQMKATGKTVEALEKKHSILEDQLKASQSKTEALSNKIEVATRLFGENSNEVLELKTKLAQAQTAEERVRQAVDKCNRELEDQRAAAKEAESATRKLTATINKQQDEVNDLRREYADAVLQYGETSDEARDLGKKLSKLTRELKDNKKALADAEKKADELDDSLDNVGDSAESAGDGFTTMKGIVADLASSAIQAAINKLGEFIGYLADLPEATRELRQDMATLETSFESAGFTVDQAKGAWTDLYAIFGEDDRAVEAANLISKMAKDQEDLNDWVTITKGVWGSYQDSLPVEGLAEASNETAKTGKVTGVLADALNWSSEAASMFAGYMSEDVTTAEDAFNEALADCTTEQERQALITETLTSLYGDAAKSYDEASGAQLDAKRAAAENMQAQAELAETIEPATTLWTELKTELVRAVIPAFKDLMGPVTNALKWLKEHPAALKSITVTAIALISTLGALVTAFGPVAKAVGVISQGFGKIAPIVGKLKSGFTLLTTKLGALGSGASSAGAGLAGVVAPAALIIAAIVAVIAVITTLWKTSEKFRTEIKGIWSDIKNTFSEFTAGISERLGALNINFSGFAAAAWAIWKGFCDLLGPYIAGIFRFIGLVIEGALGLITSVLDIFIGLFTGNWSQLWDGVKGIFVTAWNFIVGWFGNIGTILTGTLDVICGWFGTTWADTWNGIKNFFVNIWNSITGFLSNVWNTIKNVVSVGIMAIGSLLSAAWNIITLPFRFIWENCKEYVFAAWEWIKSKVRAGIRAVWNVLSPILQSIRSLFSTVWNAIKNTVSTVVNAVRTKVTAVFNAIKAKVVSIWNGIKNTVSTAVNNVKSTVSRVFDSIKSKAVTVWNGVKSAILKPIEAAKAKVKSIVEDIKGFFNKMKLKFPNIKLPHFKIKGEFSLNPPSVPKLGIDWYKDGGIMMRPTIFGMRGSRLMAGGEAGPEAILPIDRLRGYISEAIERNTPQVDLGSLVSAIEKLADRPIDMNINGRRFAQVTAGNTDSVNGLRNNLLDRGLALE